MLSRAIENNSQYTHDMKNHLLVLQEYGKAGDSESIVNYIEKMKSEYLIAESRLWTGNKVLDSILNQKKEAAKQNNIKFDIYSTTLSNIVLSENEICAMFGNLIDNAIEACMQIKDKCKWIMVKIEQRKQMLYVEIQNNYYIEPTIKNGELISNKLNKLIHGYGLKSVKRIVDKYDGMISFQRKDKVFCVKLSFFDMDIDTNKEKIGGIKNEQQSIRSSKSS